MAQSSNLGECRLIIIDEDTVHLSDDKTIFTITIDEPFAPGMFWDSVFDPPSPTKPKEKTDITITGSAKFMTIKMNDLTTQDLTLIYQVKESVKGNLKTSEEWAKKYTNKIVDPDGWDRENFEYSWYQELITREEFENRAARSTQTSRLWMDKND